MTTTYLITGANRGIGLELCKQLAQDEHNKIIASCRTASKNLTELSKSKPDNIYILENIDISDDDVIHNLQKHINKLPSDCHAIDVLINNAGVWGDSSLENPNFSDMQDVIKINAISPLMVTKALLDNNSLSSNSKIIFITSRMGSIGDNTTGGRYSYRMSKAALNAACKSLALDLKAKNMPVGIIHPGHVITDMGGANAEIPVDESVANILQVINKLNIEQTGTFYHANGQELQW